ncbi:MAG: DUF4190 domain-containing protein [Lachnospiraceae bacterium]|nr:DUF4190 domain-containing protein [Lachnospiraceae bacterium]
MKCPVCGTENLDGVSFCAGCGGSLASMQGGMSGQPSMNSMNMGQPAGQMPMNNGVNPSPLGGMMNPSYQEPVYSSQYPMQQYPNQQYGYQQPMPMNNGMYGQPMQPMGNTSVSGLGISGMICGICSVVFFWFPVIGLLVGLVGAILSAVDMSNKKNRNSGMAIAGLVCGILGVIFAITCWITCGSPTNCYGAW